MTKQDRIRLLKIDNALVELEAEIEATRVSERASSRTLLLGSKALVYKYQSLQRKRTNLMRSVSQRVTRQETYSEELENRKRAADLARKDKLELEQTMATLIGSAMASGNDVKDEIKSLRAMIRSKDIIIRNKEKAVENWLNKLPQEVPIPRIKMYVEKEREKEIAQYKYDSLTNDTHKPENNASFDLLTRPEEKEQESTGE